MKKFSLIISALALVLGLAQCAKRPNMPTLGGVEPSTKTITFTTNGGNGAKGDFVECEEDLQYVLKYKWDMNNDNDVIHVYIQEDGDAFTGGHYVGVMDMTDLSDDGYTATFSGTFTDEFPTNGWIRFVHYGRSINVKEGAMVEAVSFSAQNGTLQTISDNVVAICDKKITEDCAYNFNCDLTVQFAVVKFTFGAFEGEGDVTLYRLAKNGLKVNTTGAVEYTDGTSSTLEGMDVNKTEYYTVLMPKSETSYIFTDGSKVAYKKAAATAGVFYTKNAAGEPVTIDVIPDVLPGVFSVAPGKQVCFSKGNLQYLPCGLPAAPGTYVDMFRFADNQWDYLGKNSSSAGVELPGYTEYNKPDGTRSAARDLFGWGTACLEGTSVPWQCAKDNTLYGPTSGNLNEGEASGPNYEKYDWGHLMTPANMWRTLSASEFKYVFEGRNDSNEYHTQGNKMLGGYGWLTLPDKSQRFGAFILPDDYYCTTDGRPEHTGKTDWSYTSANLDDYKIVFLPVGGYREGGELINIGTGGHSWTSTAKGDAYAIIIDYNNGGQQINFEKEFDRYEGANVRLVLNR